MVSVIYGGKKEEVCGRFSTVGDLLKSMNINNVAVLVKIGEDIVTPDEKIKASDTVEIIRIVSRG
ncbi:MAG: MoaD/ThiS family protein [Candidatus Aenigmarchaeota archaeon]|nr:MoaD/ThiS family protein [Candidatus Aenigmarchaeota archaeon]